MAGPVDGAHPATADELLEPVAAQLCADQRVLAHRRFVTGSGVGSWRALADAELPQQRARIELFAPETRGQRFARRSRRLVEEAAQQLSRLGAPPPVRPQLAQQ